MAHVMPRWRWSGFPSFFSTHTANWGHGSPLFPDEYPYTLLPLCFTVSGSTGGQGSPLLGWLFHGLWLAVGPGCGLSYVLAGVMAPRVFQVCTMVSRWFPRRL